MKFQSDFFALMSFVELFILFVRGEAIKSNNVGVYVFLNNSCRSEDKCGPIDIY